MLDQDELFKILPHAYPFLMIDRVLEIKKGESLTAIKNITGNEWIFQNQHCPIDHLPEPFLIEAAAQAALVLYHINKINSFLIKPQYTLGLIKFKMNGYCHAGDQLRIEAFANKMLYTGGFSEILLYKNVIPLGKVEIFYSVKR